MKQQETVADGKAFSAREKILLHLFLSRGRGNEYAVPGEMTQRGMADVLSIQRPHVSMVLKDMRTTGFVAERTVHAEKEKRRVKGYSLTPLGIEQAKIMLASMNMDVDSSHGLRELLYGVQEKDADQEPDVVAQQSITPSLSTEPQTPTAPTAQPAEASVATGTRFSSSPDLAAAYYPSAPPAQPETTAETLHAQPLPAHPVPAFQPPPAHPVPAFATPGKKMDSSTMFLLALAPVVVLSYVFSIMFFEEFQEEICFSTCLSAIAVLGLALFSARMLSRGAVLALIIGACAGTSIGYYQTASIYGSTIFDTAELVYMAFTILAFALLAQDRKMGSEAKTTALLSMGTALAITALTAPFFSHGFTTLPMAWFTIGAGTVAFRMLQESPEEYTAVVPDILLGIGIATAAIALAGLIFGHSNPERIAYMLWLISGVFICWTRFSGDDVGDAATAAAASGKLSITLALCVVGALFLGQGAWLPGALQVMAGLLIARNTMKDVIASPKGYLMLSLSLMASTTFSAWMMVFGSA